MQAVPPGVIISPNEIAALSPVASLKQQMQAVGEKLKCKYYTKEVRVLTNTHSVSFLLISGICW